MSLIKTNKQSAKMLPCGFLKNGNVRPLSNNSLLFKMKRHHEARGTRPKLAICVTMFNEDEKLLKYSMDGIIQNYEAMCQDPTLKFHPHDFIVVVVCDGFERIPDSFLKFAEEKGFFDKKKLLEKGFANLDSEGNFKMKQLHEIMDPEVKEIPRNLLHMFMIQSTDYGVKNEYYGHRKMNFMFALKQRNDGKINSHKWFFQGIMRYINAQQCMTIDIGTKPDEGALVKLYKFMEANPTCGGSIGEIEVALDQVSDRNSWWVWLLVLMQYFEYKTSYYPGKNFESQFGYLMCLPGAYAMFRWNAVKGEPLDKFLKLFNSDDDPSWFEACEYLTEDRIISCNIYIKTNDAYYHAFVPNAGACTDVPEDVVTLLHQRRRWTNGGETGNWRIILNTFKMLDIGGGSHSICQKLMMLTYLPMFWFWRIVSFIGPGMTAANCKFMLIFVANCLCDTPAFKEAYPKAHGIIVSKDGDWNLGSIINHLFLIQYLHCLLVCIASPIQHVAKVITFYMGIMWIIGFTNFVFITRGVFSAGFFHEVEHIDPVTNVKTTTKEMTMVGMFFMIQIALFILPFIMRPINFLANIPQYLLGGLFFFFAYPPYSIMFYLYACTNSHNVSWGNRPASGTIEDKERSAKKAKALQDNFMQNRVMFSIIWIGFNTLTFICYDNYLIWWQRSKASQSIKESSLKNTPMGFMNYIFIGLPVLQFVLGSVNVLKHNLSQFCCPSRYSFVYLKKRKPNSEEYEAMLDCESEDEHQEPVKKSAKNIKKGKHEEETDEDNSIITDDNEAYMFM